jgi:hypothetical protein
MPRPRSLVLVASGGISVALMIWLLTSYRISEYHGDGAISDSGFWSYPRYSIALDPFPLFETGTHKFLLAGLPREEMSLTLDVLGKSEKDRKMLAKLRNKIEASLVDDEGHVVCKASGNISDGITEKGWIITSTDSSAAVYHRACVDVPVHNHGTYVLTVGLSDVDSDSTAIYVKPYISGGGNELP